MKNSNNDIGCSPRLLRQFMLQAVGAILFLAARIAVNAQAMPSGAFIDAPYTVQAGQTLEIHFYFDINYIPLPVYVQGTMIGMGPGDSSSELYNPGNHISANGEYVFGTFTPAADSLGETITISLDYCGQTTIKVVPKPPPSGSLQVNINPIVVVNAGGRWQVDGGPWQTSGTIVSNLSLGSHAVSFSSVGGWPAPPNQTVTIAEGQLTKTSATYLQQFGSLQLTLSPEEAVRGGAQWKLDNGAWQNSGQTIQDLPVGAHTITYATIFGWSAPAIQSISISPNQTTNITGSYIGPHAATASAVLANGFVVGGNVVDAGCGYTNAPSVSFIGGGGSGAQGIATISNGVVTAITILNPGSGYTSAPAIVMNPPYLPSLSLVPAVHVLFASLNTGQSYQLEVMHDGNWTNADAPVVAADIEYSFYVDHGNYRMLPLPLPTGATATAQLANVFVVGVNITSGGSGYQTAPKVTLAGGGGSGAQAIAVLSNGVVSAITIVNPGSGYTSAPSVQIDPPPVPVLAATSTSALKIELYGITPYLTFQLQSSPDFSNWTNLGTPFSTTNGINSHYVEPKNGCKFFRLQTVP